MYCCCWLLVPVMRFTWTVSAWAKKAPPGKKIGNSCHLVGCFCQPKKSTIINHQPSHLSDIINSDVHQATQSMSFRMDTVKRKHTAAWVAIVWDRSTGHLPRHQGEDAQQQTAIVEAPWQVEHSSTSEALPEEAHGKHRWKMSLDILQQLCPF